MNDNYKRITKLNEILKKKVFNIAKKVRINTSLTLNYETDLIFHCD